MYHHLLLLSFSTILIVVKCASTLPRTTANITVWPVFASRNSTTVVLSDSEMVPSTIDCHKDGKTYKQGEIWSSGHLRFKCMKLGAYTILGCRTKNDRPLSVGETYIDDFIAYQCFKRGSTTYYRESACDLVGQPSCDSFRKVHILLYRSIINYKNNFHIQIF
ncbi:unnamed protein product [Gongylonema pulchrum]|uniref:SUEL-type lectin domain-containing protein n=1 Tax=Gongylonema pulchrum TaxID=637853 RepID=A0A183D6F1_9BILA|nr:unnamed protein product [Gongylonema pulchrum]